MGDMTRREAILGGLGLVGMLGTAGAQELESVADEYSLDPDPESLELAKRVYQQEAHEGVSYAVNGNTTVATVNTGESQYTVTVDMSKKSRPIMAITFGDLRYEDVGLDGNVNRVLQDGKIVYNLDKLFEKSEYQSARAGIEARNDFYVKAALNVFRS